jgi:hypothetical protein
MTEDTLIRVDGISKKFCRNLKKSLWYGIIDIGREIAGRASSDDNLRKEEFWALKEASFQLKRGMFGTHRPQWCREEHTFEIVERPDQAGSG